VIRPYVLGPGCLVTGIARATLHDVRATCEDVTGEGSIDPSDPVGTLKLRVRVGVGSFKTGSFLQDVALRRHVDVVAHPEAVFEVDGATGTLDAAQIEARLTYRGITVPIHAQARLEVSPDAASGEASFDVDLRQFGLERPKFLILQVDDVVHVEARLRARAR